ncbi:MAG TPA: hypothetical protein VGM92_08705, partial [Candidatus Kapabacteria bacterium]
MNIRSIVLLSVLALAAFAFSAGCAPSTSSTNTSFDFTNADAGFKGNVSNIYSLKTTTVGSWSGIDISWIDSTHTLRSLDKDMGKPILLSFWMINPSNPSEAAEEPSLDSAQRDLGDSVGIVTIEEAQNLTTDYNYAISNGITVPILVDSDGFAQIEYVSAVNGSVGDPQVFVLKPSGAIMMWNPGILYVHDL